MDDKHMMWMLILFALLIGLALGLALYVLLLKQGALGQGYILLR